jgi:monofunctional biosynthetic peptidoglycan transglycosylase
MAGRKVQRRSGKRLFWLAVIGLVLGWLGYEIATLPSEAQIARLKTETPRETAIMRARKAEAKAEGKKLSIWQQPVRIDQVSPEILSAVITSEDARFFGHPGIDMRELRAAVEAGLDGKKMRGASTLTQQLAKNLYLSESRSVLRKAKEAWIAWRFEQQLSKKRILTLYLNEVEWGDGVFGIEAAARKHLKKSASDATLAEAAALAAMLPNPHRINPSNPGELRRRALHVLDRMAEDRQASAAEISAAREQLETWLGGLSEQQKAKGKQG